MAFQAHSARATRGFTLLEVMIALAILAVSLVAVAGINASAIDMHAYAKRLTVATLLARSKMADLESQLMSEDLPADDTAEEGTFEDDGFPEYHWHAEIIRPKTENVTPADLLAAAGLGDDGTSKSPSAGGASGSGGLLSGLLGGASATGAPPGQSAMMSAAASGGAGLLGGAMTSQVQSMLDMLGKSVREVHLTVSWQAGTQVDQFTVVTHVVSFGANTATANSDPTQQAALSGAANGANAAVGPNGLLNGLPGANGAGAPGMLNLRNSLPLGGSVPGRMPFGVPARPNLNLGGPRLFGRPP